MRWRKGKTRDLNTAEGKKSKKEKSIYCPVSFLFLFFFHLHYGETTMEMLWESMHRPSPQEVQMCLGRFLFPSRSIPHTVQSEPVAGWLWLSLSCFSSRLRVCRTFRLAGGGQGLVDGWLEAAHMLHGGTVRLHGLHVLIQDGKNLIVQDLVLPDPVCHLLQGL